MRGKGKSKEEIIEKIQEPMDDSMIREYLPDPKIITNKELNNMNSIDDLFDMDKFIDYRIILFLDDVNKGHWTVINKYGEGKECFIEFFDSYGNPPEKVYDFVDKQKRKELGTENNKLCELLNKCPYKVIYNPIKYQAENNEDFDVNTCGRHCCYRVLQLIGKGKILPEYYDYMNEAKKHYKKPFDIIVSELINL